jgi:hypothetical protein
MDWGKSAVVIENQVVLAIVTSILIALLPILRTAKIPVSEQVRILTWDQPEPMLRLTH